MAPEDLTRRRRITGVILASVLLAGLGHLMLGRLGRALVWFGGLMLIIGLATESQATEWQAWVLYSALAGFAALDAALIASRTSVPGS